MEFAVLTSPRLPLHEEELGKDKYHLTITIGTDNKFDMGKSWTDNESVTAT